MKIRTKAVMAVIVGGVVYMVASYLGYVPGMRRQASAVPEAVDLSTSGAATSDAAKVTEIGLPTTKPAVAKGPQVRVTIYPWTALHGFIYAVGGPATTQGSLMEKHGVNLKIMRQDDVEKMKAAQAQFATALKGGSNNPSEGTHFVIIMGDGGATYIQTLNAVLKPLGEEYNAEVIGSVGFSRGEDAWWGQQEWKDNPETMKGAASAAYLRDGDWNLAQYKLANDGIKSNPDETTWDPDAHNWFAAADFLKAAEMYISGYCEDRQVVRNGKVTNEAKHHVCVQGVATWTPADVNMAKGKGGLTKLISTKENAYQMPAIIVGIKAWDLKNAKLVGQMLGAALEGSDQVRHYETALSRTGQVAFNIYNEQTPAYWVKYYKGVRERDKTGVPVELGGSIASNLADNLQFFGLAPGAGGVSGSAWKATYEGFGKLVSRQYPKILPSFPPADAVFNPQYLQGLSTTMRTDDPEGASFAEAAPIPTESVVAKRTWNITFDTGKATFQPAATAVLDELYAQLLVGGALAVQVDGHTDNVGDPISNQALSMARSTAVKRYLEVKAPTLFPTGRVLARGFGATVPVASNETADGRAKNRRVVITLGTQP